jgi:hypothetical protein
VHRLAAALYVALLGASFVDYYVRVRGAAPDETVDYTPVVILLALAGLILGLLIGRWWVTALPLATFPFAAVMGLVASLDDRYRALAPDRGGAVGLDWFGVAALVSLYAVPAVAVGVGLHTAAGAIKPEWRWAGLAAALVVWVAATFTFGVGLLLTPVSLAVSVVALRRLAPPRGWLPWLGLAVNVLLLIPLAIWVLPSLLAA